MKLEDFQYDLSKVKNYLLDMVKSIVIGNTILVEIDYAYELLKVALENELLTVDEAKLAAKSLTLSRVFVFDDEERQANKRIKISLKKIGKFLDGEEIDGLKINDVNDNIGKFVVDNFYVKPNELTKTLKVNA